MFGDTFLKRNLSSEVNSIIRIECICWSGDDAKESVANSWGQYGIASESRLECDH